MTLLWWAVLAYAGGVGARWTIDAARTLRGWWQTRPVTDTTAFTVGGAEYGRPRPPSGPGSVSNPVRQQAEQLAARYADAIERRLTTAMPMRWLTPQSLTATWSPIDAAKPLINLDNVGCTHGRGICSNCDPWNSRPFDLEPPEYDCAHGRGICKKCTRRPQAGTILDW